MYKQNSLGPNNVVENLYVEVNLYVILPSQLSYIVQKHMT